MSSNALEKKREDPLIDEVRAVRKALCDGFDDDLEKLCDYLAEIESRNQHRVVRPSRAGERNDRSRRD